MLYVLIALQDYTALCWVCCMYLLHCRATQHCVGVCCMYLLHCRTTQHCVGCVVCTYCTAGLHSIVLGCAVCTYCTAGLHSIVLGVLYVLIALQDYIAGKLHAENDAIARDERQIRNYQESTRQMKGQLEELRTKARVFQVMKCETCKSGLRLPAVHFLCQHSYHLRCVPTPVVLIPTPNFTDLVNNAHWFTSAHREYSSLPPSCLEEGEDGHFHCPVCQSDNQTVAAILQELDSVTNVNEDFHRQVGRVIFGGGAHGVCVHVCDIPLFI